MEHAEQRKDFPPGSLNRNIRDVLCHLHHWHLVMMEWYNIGMSGSKPEMPAKGYTWKTVPELNKWIWDYYGNTSLEKAKKISSQATVNFVKLSSNTQMMNYLKRNDTSGQEQPHSDHI